MTPPYTTSAGVQIGSAYAAPQRPYHDRDALLLQDALLGNKRMDLDGIAIAVVCAIFVFFILALHWSR